MTEKGKRGASYRIRWIDPTTGSPRSEACGRDKALARLRRDAKRAELRDGLSGRLPDRTLRDLHDELASFMAGKSPNTIRKTRGSLDKLIELCGDRRLAHVDRGMVMDFRARRYTGKVAATANKDWRQIKSALSYAVDAGWLRANPLWRWKGMQLKEPEKRLRVVEPSEFEALMAASPNPVFRVMMLVSYQQGLRRTEVVNLRWSAVDFKAGVLHVLNIAEADELTKSRRNRSLPMIERVQSELAALFEDVPKVLEAGVQRPKFPHCFTWGQGDPYLPDWVTHEFARVLKRAKIPHCSFHDLRRSFSTLAQRAGVDRITVKDLGGWSTVGVVERHYTGEVPEVFQRAMQIMAAAQKGVQSSRALPDLRRNEKSATA